MQKSRTAQTYLIEALVLGATPGSNGIRAQGCGQRLAFVLTCVESQLCLHGCEDASVAIVIQLYEQWGSSSYFAAVTPKQCAGKGKQDMQGQSGVRAELDTVDGDH